MLAAILALLAIGAPSRPFPEERELLDRRLETLRRILPDGPNLAADVTLVKDMATAAHLSGIDPLARPPQENPKKGEVIVDLTAFGRLPDLDRFFRSVALSYRPIDVESLTLTATPESVVRPAVPPHRKPLPRASPNAQIWSPTRWNPNIE